MINFKEGKNIRAAIMIALVISLIFNIVLSIDSHKYKYKAGKEACNGVLSIRTINESSNEILKNVIDNKTISNEDLLKLYMNYTDISENISDLWYEYNYYIEEKSILDFHKINNIDEEIGIISEVNERIEDFIRSILDLEMKTENDEMHTSDEMLYMFTEMYNISTDIKNMYSDFVDPKLSGLKGEKRIKKLIKEYYWIDILEKLNEINDKYLDVEFILNK